MKINKRLVLYYLIFLFVLPWPLQAQTEAGEGQAYVIQLNDSLWKLADKYLGNGNAYPSIVTATADRALTDAAFTPITNPGLIFPGQKIWIPAAVSSPVVDTNHQSANEPATQAVPAPPTPPSSASLTSRSTSGSIRQPTGHVAFSFWNNHAGRCTYEINIISVPDCLSSANQCQATRRIMSLNNISEPALAADGDRLAFRGWGEPLDENSPYLGCAPAHPFRFLGHTTLDGTEFVGTGGFWEDSHPAISQKVRNGSRSGICHNQSSCNQKPDNTRDCTRSSASVANR